MADEQVNQKWDYIWDRELSGDRVGETLTARGQQGWELVAATENAETWSLFFKRRLVGRDRT